MDKEILSVSIVRESLQMLKVYQFKMFRKRNWASLGLKHVFCVSNPFCILMNAIMFEIATIYMEN